MNTRADITVIDGIAHIALNTGPSARLTASVLQQIEHALADLADKDDVHALVLGGQHGFPSGLTDPLAGGDDTDATQPKVCEKIEAYDKPVIALVTGTLVGHGAEVALACHYRVVHSDARIGFPNVRLGLVPNGGATQRLPRLVGAAASLELLLGGQLLPFRLDRLAPLTDHGFQDDAFTAVTSFVTALRDKGLSPRPTSNRRDGFADAQAYQATINQTRKTLGASPENAPKHILSAVEAALVLPMAAGLAFEQAAYEDVTATPQSRALTHLFLSEQAAAAEMRRQPASKVTTVGVLGGGATASQIVLSLLDAGLAVKWFIKNPGQQRDSVGYVQSALQDAVKAGRLPAGKAQQCKDAMNYGAGADLLADVDIALRVARGQRGAPVPDHVPIAHCLPGADPKLALQFGPPGQQPRLLEIVIGPEATDADAAQVQGLARQLSMFGVVERTGDLALLDRLRVALWRSADSLVDLGQSPYLIDAALRSWGVQTPPFQAADQFGLALIARHDRRPDGTNWPGVLTQHGKDGTASGAGFYRYDTLGRAMPDPDVDTLLNELRASKSDLPDAIIRSAILGALTNTAIQALREGVVPRASDIDLVSTMGGLIPRWRGGVLHATAATGLLRVTRVMADLSDTDTAIWTPDPLWAELIKNGKGFDDLRADQLGVS